MPERPYPRGIDCVWLAVDRQGHLGAFVTGGAGPIPASVLDAGSPPLEDVEQRVSDLPKVSSARLLVRLNRPDDFIAIAERGLFVYDWSDVHRSHADALRAYEPIAVPTNPLPLASLADAAVKSMASTKIGVAFSDEVPLDVRKYVHCRDGDPRSID